MAVSATPRAALRAPAAVEWAAPAAVSAASLARSLASCGKEQMRDDGG